MTSYLAHVKAVIHRTNDGGWEAWSVMDGTLARSGRQLTKEDAYMVFLDKLHAALVKRGFDDPSEVEVRWFDPWSNFNYNDTGYLFSPDGDLISFAVFLRYVGRKAIVLMASGELLVEPMYLKPALLKGTW